MTTAEDKRRFYLVTGLDGEYLTTLYLTELGADGLRGAGFTLQPTRARLSMYASRTGSSGRA